MTPQEKIFCVLKEIKDQIELTPESKLKNKERKKRSDIIATSRPYRKLGVRVITGDILAYCDLNFFELENILEKLKEKGFFKSFSHIQEVLDNYFQILPSEKFNNLYEEFQNKIKQESPKEKRGRVDNLRQKEINLKNLHPEIYKKCHTLYEKGEYAEAVEKSFKVVKDKLRKLTGYEKGSEAFGKGKLHIKGASAPHVDKDFNAAVKFLTMSIDFFRNEKSHTSDAKIENPIRAYEYLRLSSLAMHLLENAEIK